MADELKADYNELEQLSRQFKSAAEVFAEGYNKIVDSYNKLEDGKGWIGLGSTAFANEMFGVFNTGDHLIEALGQAGETTGKISQVLKTAEEQASALFRH
jgi:WXG100 family type VII secretion target